MAGRQEEGEGKRMTRHRLNKGFLSYAVPDNVGLKSTNQESARQKNARSGGSLFFCESSPALTLEQYYHHFVDGTLNSQGYDLLQVVTQQILNDHDHVTDIANLIDATGKSRMTLVRRLISLESQGFVRRVQRKEKSLRGTYNEYHLILPSRAPMETSETQPENPADCEAQELKSSGDQRQRDEETHLDYGHLIERGARLPIKAESLSILALFSALPSGTRGELAESAYTVPITIGPDKIKITVRPTSGTRAANVLDLRVLAAVITIVFYRIERGHPPINPFVIELEEILDLFRQRAQRADYMQGGSAKQYVMGALSRWESTGFTIEHVTPGTKNFYDDSIQIDKMFRLINSITVLSHVGTHGKTPERIALYLDNQLVDRIAEPGGRYLITMSDTWITERNPAAIKFGAWARRAVKRKWESDKVYSREYLHREVDPRQKAKIFYSSLRKLYSKFFDSRHQAAYIHGYFLLAEPGHLQYQAWADPDHPLLGKNSYGAILLLDPKLTRNDRRR